MREVISTRLAALVKDGEELLRETKELSDNDWVDDADVAEYETWLGSTGILLHAIGGSRAPFFSRFRDIVTSQTNPAGVKVFVVRRVYGLLLSTLEEWTQGTLQKVEDMFTAAAFDDLLDDAERFLGEKRSVESCALTVTVLEHAVKRIAAKHGVTAAPEGFDGLVAALRKTKPACEEDSGLLAKCATLRKRLDESGWSAAALKDVEAMTSATRQLIEQCL